MNTSQREGRYLVRFAICLFAFFVGSLLIWLADRNNPYFPFDVFLTWPWFIVAVAQEIANPRGGLDLFRWPMLNAVITLAVFAVSAKWTKPTILCVLWLILNAIGVAVFMQWDGKT